MKTINLIAFYLIVISSSTQNLEGKWLLIKGGDTYIIPENLILEINSDSLKYFSFDEMQSSVPIKLENKKIIINQKKTVHFEFLNDNRIKIKSPGRVNDKDSLITTEYVRLLKTKTKLSQEVIQSLSFQFNWNNEKFKVIFNTELGNPQVIEVLNKEELTKVQLEKIDFTYFISIYESGKRETVIPIKEISRNRMILYGMPEKPYEIVGE